MATTTGPVPVPDMNTEALAEMYKARMDAIYATLFKATGITVRELAAVCDEKARVDEAVREARVLLHTLLTQNVKEIGRHLATGHPTGSIGAVEAAKERLGRDMRLAITRLTTACHLATAQTEDDQEVRESAADGAPAGTLQLLQLADATLAEAGQALDDMKRIAALLATCARLLVAFTKLKGQIGHPHAHNALIGYIIFGFDRPLALAAQAQAEAASGAVTLMSPTRLHNGATAPIAVPDAGLRPTRGALERTSPISGDAETTRREHAAVQNAVNEFEMLVRIAESMVAGLGPAGAVALLPPQEKAAIRSVWSAVLDALLAEQWAARSGGGGPSGPPMRAVALVHNPAKNRTACRIYQMALFFSIDLWTVLASKIAQPDIELFLANLHTTVDLMREATAEGTAEATADYDYFTLAEPEPEPEPEPELEMEAQAPKRRCLGDGRRA